MAPSFSPLDMLDMQDSEQAILRCLNRRPSLTIAEIASATGLSAEETESVLRGMVDRSQVVELLQNGQRIFSARFSRLQSRQLHVPARLLDLFKEEPDTFLEEVPLTVMLTPQERETLASKSVLRQMMPNEVAAWQGDRFKQVGLVRMGLLKKSRIKKGQRKQAMEYTRRAEWFGLSEVLSEYPSLETYTAVAESELLVWPAEEFSKFLRTIPNLALAVNRLLGQQLHQCYSQRIHGAGHLWATESVEDQTGATTFAANLALLLCHNGGNGSETRPRVVLWNAHDSGEDMVHMLGMNMPSSGTMLPGQSTVLTHNSGLDVVLRTEKSNYPPQVQLDIILTDLRSQYDYIICDTGHDPQDELLLRLRGQADALITMTRRSDGAREAANRWNAIHPYSRPGQKRMLTLSQVASNGMIVDPAFHLVLPYDPENAKAANGSRQPIVEAVPHSPLAQAFVEAYRRLSLTHVIGIFVPSTMDVDQSTDNKTQVQAVLSFLGGIFGGATSSEAEGVWQSENGLVVEQVTIVRTFVSKKALEQHLDEVVSFATQLKKEMRQEAVAIDVDNQLILV